MPNPYQLRRRHAPIFARIRRSHPRRLAPTPERLETRALLATIKPSSRDVPLEVSSAWFTTLNRETPFSDHFAQVAWQDATVAAVPNQWIVQLSQRGLQRAPSVAAAATLLADAPFALQVNRGLGLAGSLLVTAPGVPTATLTGWMAAQSMIASFEPNLIRSIDATPNDTSFSVLWGLNNTGQSGGLADADIDAPEAWSLSTGSASVVVGIIDTGVDTTHPDLAANIWTNPGEVAGNGIDDDANGFIDDVHGYDFVNNDSNPADDHGHGTHVAGTVGAVGNNALGVVGVNWTTSMMALKMMNANGTGPISAEIAAINYTTMMRQSFGINIVATNNSYGSTGASTSEYNSIRANGEAGVLFAAAAGNSASDNDNDAAHRLFPASYDLASIVSVAATTRTDQLASFSSYGATTVDLAAPGASIVSTYPGGYATLSGTSMATPHVTGAIALAWAYAPTLSAPLIRQALLDSVDPLAALNGKVSTGGRLNVHGLLEQLSSGDAPSLPDLVAASDTGTSATDNLTRLDNRDAANALRFNIPGVQSGATVTLYIDGIAAGSAVASGTSVEVVTNGSRDLADGAHSITARQTPLGGTESPDSFALSIVVDTVISADIVDVTPDPRNGGIDSVVVTFGEPVAGVTVDDFTPTRDSTLMSMGAATLTTSDQATWTLAGLSTLTQTAATYRVTLTATGAGIVDMAGNLLAANALDIFTVNASLRALGTASLANSTTVGAQFNPSVSAWASGSYVVAWEASPVAASFARVFSSAGSALTGEIRLNLASTPVAGVDMQPQVAALPGGDFVAAWTGSTVGDPHGVYLQRFSASGARLGAEQRVNVVTASAQGSAALAVDSAGRIAVLWTSQGQDGSGNGVYMRWFDAAGNALGGEVAVNTVVSGDQSAPAAAFGSSGDLFVVWQSAGQDGDGWGVYGRRFNSAGAALGADFLIDPATLGDQYQPAIARDAAGNSVVTWTSTGGTPGAGRAIFFRRYNAAGVATSAPVQADSSRGTQQSSPTVAMQGGGTFLVAWQNQVQDGSSWGVFGRRFGASGAPLEQELRLNARVSGAQKSPAGAADGGGGYIFAWDGSGPGDDAGVYVQRFAEAPTAGVVLTIDDASIREGQLSPPRMTFTIRASSAPIAPVTVGWRTVNGTATSPADFTAASGVVTLAAGQTTATISVALVNDALDELDETFQVELFDASGATIGDASAIGTILDDDPAPNLYVYDETISEGNTGARSIRFRVVLSRASGLDLGFDYQTVNGTAIGGSDFTASSGRVTVPAGARSVFVDVPVLTDTTVEPDESFTLRISNASFATIVDAEGVGTLINDDTRVVITDVTSTEGNSGTKLFVFTVSLNAPAPFEIAVSFQTIDGTAIAGSDYTALPTTQLTFAPGQTSKTISVTVAGDTATEPDETFQIQLSAARNALITDRIGVGTIVNDDGGAGGSIASLRSGATHGFVVAGTTVALSDDVGWAPTVSSARKRFRRWT